MRALPKWTEKLPKIVKGVIVFFARCGDPTVGQLSLAEDVILGNEEVHLHPPHRTLGGFLRLLASNSFDLQAEAVETLLTAKKRGAKVFYEVMHSPCGRYRSLENQKIAAERAKKRILGQDQDFNEAHSLSEPLFEEVHIVLLHIVSERVSQVEIL